MKIEIMLKDPDGVYDAVREAVKESVAATPGLADDEREAVEDARLVTTWESLEKWIQYQEYVKIEIDTDAGTAVVVPFK